MFSGKIKRYNSYSKVTEAFIQRSTWEKVFRKYAANLQENTDVDVYFNEVAHLPVDK